MRPFYLAGEWREGVKSFEVRSPFDERVLETVAKPGPQEADEALTKVALALEVTRRLPAHVRADALLDTSDGVAERADELARIITDESGSP